MTTRWLVLIPAILLTGCSIVRYTSSMGTFTRYSLGTDLRAQEIVATFAYGRLATLRLGLIDSQQGDAAAGIVEGGVRGVAMLVK